MTTSLFRKASLATCSPEFIKFAKIVPTNRFRGYRVSYDEYDHLAVYIGTYYFAYVNVLGGVFVVLAYIDHWSGQTDRERADKALAFKSQTSLSLLFDGPLPKF